MNRRILLRLTSTLILVLIGCPFSKAQLPTITLEAKALQGNILDDPAVTVSKSVLVEDGSQLRFAATAAYVPPRYSVRSIEFTVSQGAAQLSKSGPPGHQLDAKSKRRVVPVCRPKQACALPTVTVSRALGSATVSARAIGIKGDRTITVSYFPVDTNNSGSANLNDLPPASGPCTANGVQIALKPSYVFNNDAKKLMTASFYFSATYIGPNPGDPPCAGPLPGVSGTVGPAAIEPASDSVGDNAEIPGIVYIGNITAVGTWHLVAYSPQVGVTVTCDRKFGNNGIVIMKVGSPNSVDATGTPGMCY